MDERPDEVAFFELQWRLSNINPNIPAPLHQPLIDLKPETLLMQDIVALEHQVAEYKAIVESYRELSQICLEAAARHYNNCIKLTRENKVLRELL